MAIISNLKGFDNRRHSPLMFLFRAVFDWTVSDEKKYSGCQGIHSWLKQVLKERERDGVSIWSDLSPVRILYSCSVRCRSDFDG